jgi:hypothetical protein
LKLEADMYARAQRLRAADTLAPHRACFRAGATATSHADAKQTLSCALSWVHAASVPGRDNLTSNIKLAAGVTLLLAALVAAFLASNGAL